MRVGKLQTTRKQAPQAPRAHAIAVLAAATRATPLCNTGRIQRNTLCTHRLAGITSSTPWLIRAYLRNRCHLRALHPLSLTEPLLP